MEIQFENLNRNSSPKSNCKIQLHVLTKNSVCLGHCLVVPRNEFFPTRHLIACFQFFKKVLAGGHFLDEISDWLLKLRCAIENIGNYIYILILSET